MTISYLSPQKHRKHILTLKKKKKTQEENQYASTEINSPATIQQYFKIKLIHK